MSAVDELVKELEAMGVRNFNVFKGPNWNEATPDERAAEIFASIKAVQRGECEELVLDDYPIELRD